MTTRERTEVLVRAPRDAVIAMANSLDRERFLLERSPEKATVMVPMQDPVHKTIFYIGEVLVCSCMASLNAVKGHNRGHNLATATRVATFFDTLSRVFSGAEIAPEKRRFATLNA